MHDPGTALITCSDCPSIVTAINRVITTLPVNMRKRLNSVFSNYLARYGLEGAAERMSNRTVSQIIAEFEPTDPPIVASGEVGGVRYTLYKAPPTTRHDPDATS